ERLKIKETKDNSLKRHLGILCYHLGLYYSNVAYDVSKAKKYLMEGLDYQKSITNQTKSIKEEIIKSYRQLFKVFLNNASTDTDKKRKDKYFKTSFSYLQQLKKLSKEIGIYEKNKANFFMDCALYYSKNVKYFKNGQLELKNYNDSLLDVNPS